MVIRGGSLRPQTSISSEVQDRSTAIYTNLAQQLVPVICYVSLTLFFRSPPFLFIQYNTQKWNKQGRPGTGAN